VRTQGIFLAGIGVFLPETISIAAAARQGLVPPDLGDDQGNSGVAVAGRIPSPEMGLRAAEEAVKSSGLSAADIGLLLYTGVWHHGPDGWGPQYYLQRHLLGDDLLAVEIRHGCNGTFSAMELAVPYLKAAPPTCRALIVASDNFGSPLISRWNPGAGLSCLGDGASAVILDTTPGFAELLCVCTTTFSRMEEAHRAGEPLFPPGATTGTTVDFGVRSQRFQRQATSRGEWMQLLLSHHKHNFACTQQALHEAGLEAGDISRVLIHSMPRQTAVSYLTILGFSLDQSTWSFSQTVGHLGAGDHLTALHHLVSAGQLGPGDNVLLCGFSPGMTYKAAVIRLLGVPPGPEQEGPPDGF
jgi:clorobiocin biosynthesis protein CloN2